MQLDHESEFHVYTFHYCTIILFLYCQRATSSRVRLYDIVAVFPKTEKLFHVSNRSWKKIVFIISCKKFDVLLFTLSGNLRFFIYTWNSGISQGNAEVACVALFCFVLFYSSCWVFAGLRLKESLRFSSVSLPLLHSCIHSFIWDGSLVNVGLSPSKPWNHFSFCPLCYSLPPVREERYKVVLWRKRSLCFGFLLCMLWGAAHMPTWSSQPLVFQKSFTISHLPILFPFVLLGPLWIYCHFRDFSGRKVVEHVWSFCQVETEHTGYFIWFFSLCAF